MKHHFDWMQFLILSGAIAAPVAQAAENASATNGPNPFINPAFDLAIFGALARAAKASQTAEPVPTPSRRCLRRTRAASPLMRCGKFRRLNRSPEHLAPDSSSFASGFGAGLSFS